MDEIATVKKTARVEPLPDDDHLFENRDDEHAIFFAWLRGRSVDGHVERDALDDDVLMSYGGVDSLFSSVASSRVSTRLCTRTEPRATRVVQR